MKKTLIALVLGILLPVAVSAAPSANVGSAIAYPNPCDARKGHLQVTFDNLPSWVRLRLYTKSGELVKDISADTTNGILAWDLTNGAGCAVATGIYLYVILDNNGYKATGKLAVIR
jgi:hypothetical protein